MGKLSTDSINLQHILHQNGVPKVTGNTSFQATVSAALMKEDTSHGLNNGTGLSPKQLFELVSKNYENWLQAMAKQFENDVNDHNYSPFPNEDADSQQLANDKSNPIFNYSLLEALDAASNDMNEQLREATSSSSNSTAKSSDGKRRILDPSTHTLLNEREIDFLRHKITQIIQHNNETSEGFNLYDTKDEEGLHEGNCGCCVGEEGDYDQDDYDLEEINGDENYAYDIPPTHHIEVELNAAPDCPIHGPEGCDCPIFSRHGHDHSGVDGEEYEDDEDSYAPSCEFMFEYDLSGKLIPTYNNVAEKLREMEANGGKFPVKKNRLKLPSIEELHARDEKKKKKTKSKESKSEARTPITRGEDLIDISQVVVPSGHLTNQTSTIPKYYVGFIPSEQCCLFCDTKLCLVQSRNR
ncbi:hypothetical protein Cantr_05790 [Candida viswanathii]|uniref:Protein IBD2 n=1 Tax=Candida viswanathii TaxID=5486 RepID=A0A367XUI0_9ASCO|nr:hypothetical protein Cantr_05790 [Candida viswanathii]